MKNKNFIIFFIVYILVTRHLSHFAASMVDFDVNQEQPGEFKLARKKVVDDELSYLADEFNKMKQQISISFKELNQRKQKAEEVLADVKKQKQFNDELIINSVIPLEQKLEEYQRRQLQLIAENDLVNKESNVKAAELTSLSEQLNKTKEELAAAQHYQESNQSYARIGEYLPLWQNQLAQLQTWQAELSSLSGSLERISEQYKQ